LTLSKNLFGNFNHHISKQYCRRADVFQISQLRQCRTLYEVSIYTSIVVSLNFSYHLYRQKIKKTDQSFEMKFDSASYKKAIEYYVESIRPPVEIRHNLDIGYVFEKQSLELFEIRPSFKNKSIIQHFPFAKTTFVKSKNEWKIFWRRANGNWDPYELHPTVKNIHKFFEIVKGDKHHCFFG